MAAAPSPPKNMEVNVLVVFYSRYGASEKLALAAGLGAIQARANIRLRRLADLAAPEVIGADAAWKENLARMNLDYVAPREADPQWADVVIFAAPAQAPGEMCAYLTALNARAAAQKPFPGKIGAPFVCGANPAALGSLYAAAASAGFTVLPDPGIGSPDEARLHGRRAAEMARALKRP